MQQEFSANIWNGLISEHLIGSHFVPPRFSDEEYRRFLKKELLGLMEENSSETMSDMVFAFFVKINHFHGHF